MGSGTSSWLCWVERISDKAIQLFEDLGLAYTGDELPEWFYMETATGLAIPMGEGGDMVIR